MGVQKLAWAVKDMAELMIDLKTTQLAKYQTEISSIYF